MGFLNDRGFWRRLRLYSIGFMLGILLVIFLFPRRCGLPDEATKQEVRESFRKDTLLLSSKVQPSLDSLGWTVKEFKEQLLEGEFLLPKRRDQEGKRFRIRMDDPPMRVHLKVLNDRGTRVDSLRMTP